MKNLINIFLVISLMIGTSCEDLVEDINDNPNAISPEDLSSSQFLTGAMLANTVVQAGHFNRIAGTWSGQLEGFQSVYGAAHQYQITSAEAEATWIAAYTGVVTNARYIVNNEASTPLLRGIAKIVEANALGTMASLFGDIPYSEINNADIANPAYDSQSAVFLAIIDDLDDAITLLGTATSGLAQDIHFSGNKDKWLEVANTLKARYYLQLKDYSNALTAAQSGISDYSGSMIFTPVDPGDAAEDNDAVNLFWQILNGGRAGDIGTGSSYLMNLLDPASATSRNNSKTDETARHGYYAIDESSGTANNGIIAQTEPHELVSYQENLLILAECDARINSLTAGLNHLNQLRFWLAGGGRLNTAYSGLAYTYDAYVAADFAAGGIENTDNISEVRAFLREVIEERYVSGFGSFIPFNDARRLRKSDGDIAVGFPTNTGTQYPERFLYANVEVNSNTSSPTVLPGLFDATPVNQ
ncbi:MAG: SusD/RagB family nutrient-binding outer membrane lipoprotein [Reichenbachiella sp.]|uniref:SusD/RagB family nutrient-binding outer membrane lipoprotein n=1 Tax=Reichenbachiella sp. TaxID=2184521 RepID=UPI0032634C1F